MPGDDGEFGVRDAAVRRNSAMSACWTLARDSAGGSTLNVGDVRNPFVGPRTAERYHQGRPYHHERTLGRILNSVPVERGIAVDVAAGTGLSTRALAALGFRAVGIEAAPVMLAVASRSDGLPYVVGAAEALPVAASAATLVAAGSAVHWFDQARFFDEARRVLRPDGVVILYDHAGVHVPGDASFGEWASTEYAARYPTPPRGSMAGNTLPPAGLARCFSETWIDTVEFTPAGLVDYLLTHTNVVEAIETGREAEDDVRSWLADATARFFDAGKARIFGFFVMAEALRAI